MTRFVAPDLASLPDPDAVEVLSHEDQTAARIADFKARLADRGLDYDVDGLETDPIVVNQQTAAYFDVLRRGRINDAVKAVLLQFASGSMLDHIAATYYGISRKMITVGDPVAIPPVPDVMETDEDFRARIPLSLEGRSTAGAAPEGSYLFHALEADGDVKDAAVYGEEDGALRSNGDPILAPEVLVIVLSHSNNGVPDQALLDKVYADLNDEINYNEADRIFVEPAFDATYTIDLELHCVAGADLVAIEAAALAAVTAEAETLHRVATVIDLEALSTVARNAAAQKDAAGAITRHLVTRVNPIAPAADFDPGSKGAARATAINITAIHGATAWRDAPVIGP